MQVRTIVVGVDFGAESEVALRAAIELAQRTGGKLLLVHAGVVVESAKRSRLASVREWERLLAEKARQQKARLENFCREIAEEGVEVSCEVVEGVAAEKLAQIAQERSADLLVLGTRGRRGVKRAVLGSVAQEAVRLCDCSVLVARAPQDAAAFSRVLVATDFTEFAERALESALELVRPNGLVRVAHFWSLPSSLGTHPTFAVGQDVLEELVEQHAREVQELGDALIDKYARDNVQLEFVAQEGPASAGIVRMAEQGDFDLIVTGSHGRRGFRRFFLGSVAESVVIHATCSVIVVHGAP